MILLYQHLLCHFTDTAVILQWYFSIKIVIMQIHLLFCNDIYVSTSTLLSYRYSCYSALILLYSHLMCHYTDTTVIPQWYFCIHIYFFIIQLLLCINYQHLFCHHIDMAVILQLYFLSNIYLFIIQLQLLFCFLLLHIFFHHTDAAVILQWYFCINYQHLRCHHTDTAVIIQWYFCTSVSTSTLST